MTRDPHTQSARSRRRAAHWGRLLLLLACLGAAVAGCGSSEEGQPIPRAQVETLNSRLDEVERRLDAGGGACGDIQDDSIPAIEQAVQEVPDSVDQDVRDALEQSVERLTELTSEQCDEEAGQQTTPEQTTPPPAPMTQEPPPPTQTQPPETQTQEEPRPQDGDGDGAGGGSGDDGSGPGGGLDEPIDPRD